MEGKELKNLGQVTSPLSLSFLLCNMVALIRPSTRALLQEAETITMGRHLKSFTKCLVLFSDLHTHRVFQPYPGGLPMV